MAAYVIGHMPAREYAQEFKESFGDSLCGVVLFGSVARAEAIPCSDIDILVVASGLL